MSANLQIISIIINLLYGIILYVVFKLNYLLVRNEPVLFKILITSLFCVDFSFLYMLIFYKLTSGIFHIYYLIALIIGIIVSHFFISVKVLSTIQKVIDKLKS